MNKNLRAVAAGAFAIAAVAGQTMPAIAEHILPDCTLFQNIDPTLHPIKKDNELVAATSEGQVICRLSFGRAADETFKAQTQNMRMFVSDCDPNNVPVQFQGYSGLHIG